MTNCIAKSLKNKNKLYKTYLNNPCKRNKNLYKRYKNKLNHVIKVSKRIYYEEQLIKYKHDTKIVWRTLNEILTRERENKRLLNEFIDVYFLMLHFVIRSMLHETILNAAFRQNEH